MAECRPPNALASQSRHAQSPDSPRPMAESRGQYAACTDEHDHQDQAATRVSQAPTTRDVGPCPDGDGRQSEQPSADTHACRDVAGLGGKPSGNASPLDKPKRRRSPRLKTDVNRESVFQLLENQQYQCALTRRPLEPQTACIDHIVALSCGGEHRMSNIQILHRDVNRTKGTLSNDEFIAICREVWLTSIGQSPNDSQPAEQEIQS